LFLAPATGFYTASGYGKDEVRIAYVLKKKELAICLKILEEALKVYPGRK
jgi:aspartate aminotransferase